MIKIVLILYFLSVTACHAADFQEVFKIDCTNKELKVEGKAYNPNEAGSSQVERRYTFNNKELKFIRYERFYKNLEDYMLKDAKNTFTLPLNISKNGLSHSGGEYKYGETLYLSPKDFSEDEYRSFATCLRMNLDNIAASFNNAKITSKYFFGLLNTSADFGVDGIARIIYADFPLKDFYTDNSYSLLLIEHNNQVIVKTNFTANNPQESVTLGKIEDNILYLKPSYDLGGKTHQSKDLGEFEDLYGEKLKEKYKIKFN